MALWNFNVNDPFILQTNDRFDLAYLSIPIAFISPTQDTKLIALPQRVQPPCAIDDHEIAFPLLDLFNLEWKSYWQNTISYLVLVVNGGLLSSFRIVSSRLTIWLLRKRDGNVLLWHRLIQDAMLFVLTLAISPQYRGRLTLWLRSQMCWI